MLASTDVAVYMDAQQCSGQSRYNGLYRVRAAVVHLNEETDSHLKVLKGFLKLDPNKLLSLREWSTNKRGNKDVATYDGNSADSVTQPGDLLT